nr:hypothetical protein GCM10025730_40500 [Promicromonospora thailandica]
MNVLGLSSSPPVPVPSSAAPVRAAVPAGVVPAEVVPARTGGAVRVTLHPGEDVLLSPGARLGEVRAPLAALLRRPELRYATLVVDGERLTDERVVGDRPLLPGAVVRTEPPGPTGRVPEAGDTELARAACAPWLVVRVTGADAGAVAGAAGPWRALLTWARLRRDGRLVLRRNHGPAAWLAPPGAAPRGGLPWAYALLPALASLGLAAALRQPLLAVFSLLSLVVAAPRLRAARQQRGGSPVTRPLPGPAGGLLWAYAALHVSSGAWETARAAWSAGPGPDRHGAPPPTPDDLVPGLLRVPPGPGAHLRSVPDGDPWEALLHDGAVAVLGPDAAARSVARALVARLAARGAQVLVHGEVPGWSWTRWLPPGGPRVVVRGATRGPIEDRVPAPDLVVSVGVLPAGCRAVVRVLDARRVRITGPDGTTRVAPLVGVTAERAEQLARLLAGAARLGRTATRGHTGLPGVVPLTAVHGLGRTPDPAALVTRWNASPDWSVPLGVGTDGTSVHLDLVRDGPHLLVAGTTGSGKSELLQTLVLGLALIRSPADLSLVLVDFKGGASLAACSGLPHVVGQVTDLDPGLAGRALAGLRTELRRRERVLAAHGVPDVALLPRGILPRLVVVIDEFRALADDLPGFLPALLRTAAQGRSLGVHLVLATQRPGGAVGPDLRANLGARVALRVTDVPESRDVIDHPGAAHLPVTTPGRALLRLGSAPPVPFQCAHVAAPHPAEVPLVRRAPSGGAGRAVPEVPPSHGGRDGAQPTAPGPDPAGLLVTAVRTAASLLGHVPGTPPWLPPLPRRATRAGLPPRRRRDRHGFAIALGDDPGHQRRTTVVWNPADGHLGVLGPARSGRTTALVTVALDALEQGWAVHVVTRDAAAFAVLHDHPGHRGTLHPDDLPGVAALLTGLSAGSPATTASPEPASATPTSAEPVRTLVVVDGAEDLRGALPAAALRSGPAFAVSADGPTVGGLAARVGPRLVLLGTDRAADVVLGAPATLAGTGGPRGRAAWCDRAEPVLCQVLEPWRLEP